MSNYRNKRDRNDRQKMKTSKPVNDLKDPKKVITEACRSSFMQIASLRRTEKPNGDEGTICTTAIIIPKQLKETVVNIRRSIRYAAREVMGSEIDPFKDPNIRIPLQDGDILLDDPDKNYGEELENAFMLNALAYNLPILRDEYNEVVSDHLREKFCKSGFWFHFSLYFQGYNKVVEQNNRKIRVRGVRCYLNSLMFVKEDEILGRRDSSQEDFSNFAQTSTDSYDDDEWDDDIPF